MNPETAYNVQQLEEYSNIERRSSMPSKDKPDTVSVQTSHAQLEALEKLQKNFEESMKPVKPLPKEQAYNTKSGDPFKHLLETYGDYDSMLESGFHSGKLRRVDNGLFLILNGRLSRTDSSLKDFVPTKSAVLQYQQGLLNELTNNKIEDFATYVRAAHRTNPIER